MSKQITITAQKYGGGLRTILNSLRAFFEYLHNNGNTGMNLSLVIPKYFAPHRKIYEGFSDKEIDRLLYAVDITTPIGKRDYAIFILAFALGLIPCGKAGDA